MKQPTSLFSAALWLEAISALGQSLRYCAGLLAMTWAAGMACDILLSPVIYPRLGQWTGHSFPLSQGPTLLGWLYLAPLLWTQCLRAVLRPGLVLPVADALSSPANAVAWRSLWWSGPLLWGLSVLPLGAWALIPEHGGLAAVAWVGLALAWLGLASAPAAREGAGGRGGLSGMALWRGAILALGGVAAAFILSNIVVGVILLPLLKGAGESGRALGILLIALSNLGVVLAIWATATAGAVGWISARNA